MATLQPFRAFRPSADAVGEVASPPYDVVSSAQARQLAEGKARSFLHVSRPEIDLPVGTDEHADEVYSRGRDNLATLIADQVLVQDEEAHLYVYEQTMGDHKQVGVVACAAVGEYDAGTIKKHERTRPDKENDRTRHIDELSAHDEPVFLTYRANPAVDEAVAAVVAGVPTYDFTSDDGVHHRFWVVDVAGSRTLARLFDEQVPALYIADGHHRSAAASRVHDKRKGSGGEHDVFLAVVFPHDQMNILAYNRVIKDREGRDAAALKARLDQALTLEPTDSPAPETPQTLGVYVGGQWYRGVPKGAIDEADPVARLDCQICQDQVLAPVFGITDPRRDETIAFVGGILGAAELKRRVDAGEADVALYLHPTSMSQVMEVSDAGEVMPPKSTWFEPKLKSGLFVHTF